MNILKIFTKNIITRTKITFANFFSRASNETANTVTRTKITFANFFLHASDEEKKRVFTDAARRANEDQRTLVESINKLERKAT